MLQILRQLLSPRHHLPARETLQVSFCFDLTDPESFFMPVGTLQVRGDSFESYSWDLDWRPLVPGNNLLIGSLFRSLPEMLRGTAEQWPAYRARHMASDTTSLAEYYCTVYQRSSFRIDRI